MRRQSFYERHRNAKLFRGSEMTRLAAMIGLLVILILMIARARESSTWTFFARQEAESQIKHVGEPDSPSAEPAKKAAVPKAEEPAVPTEKVGPTEKAVPTVAPQEAAAVEADLKPTGLTDEDPDEAEDAAYEFQALNDGSLEIGPEEMPAYERVVGWVQSQSADLMLKRATKDFVFNDFIRSPSRYRGKIVAVSMEIHLFRLHEGDKVNDVPVYEAWGITKESGTFLYHGMVIDPPKGMPYSNDEIFEKATLVGYFFKVQGFHPRSGRMGDRPEKAPMFIGRLIWKPTPPQQAEKTEWALGLFVLTLGVLAIVVGGVFHLMGRQSTRASQSRLLASRGERTMPVGDWLDSMEPEPESPEGGGGNNFDQLPESRNGHASGGMPDGEAKGRSEGLDEGSQEIR